MDIPAEDVYATKYAFCAAVDETVLNSRFAIRDAWMLQPLQLTLFGEQLAVAQEIRGMGIASVQQVVTDLGSTVFALDSRISPYCVGDVESGLNCNPPEDVLREVLTFDIDTSTIDNTLPGVAISAPVTVTVP